MTFGHRPLRRAWARERYLGRSAAAARPPRRRAGADLRRRL